MAQTCVKIRLWCPFVDRKRWYSHSILFFFGRMCFRAAVDDDLRFRHCSTAT